MKKIFLISIIVFLLLPGVVYANGAGLPPFFKINGKMSTPNPLQLYGITASSFLIPQDYTAENYVVNQPIDFEIDDQQLLPVIPEELLRNTKFSWDFGDGVKADGLKNTHIYKRIGSYILILTISSYTDPNQPPTQFIDSYLLNVLPNQNYNGLPKAIIKVSGKEVKDPLRKIVETNLQSPIVFDATSSQSKSKIVQYLWDYDDGTTSSKPVDVHKYAQQDFATVVMRVKDSNGFISDAFVNLKNNPNVKNGNTQNADYFLYTLVAIGGISLIAIIILYFKRK